MTRTKELPISMNSPHTHTVPPPRTMGKKIIRPDTSIPSKHWNMPIKLSSGRKKLIGSPRSQRGSHKSVRTRLAAGSSAGPFGMGVQFDGARNCTSPERLGARSTKGMPPAMNGDAMPVMAKSSF
jgi:hypothetical protein